MCKISLESVHRLFPGTREKMKENFCFEKISSHRGLLEIDTDTQQMSRGEQLSPFRPIAKGPLLTPISSKQKNSFIFFWVPGVSLWTDSNEILNMIATIICHYLCKVSISFVAISENGCYFQFIFEKPLPFPCFLSDQLEISQVASLIIFAHPHKISLTKNNGFTSNCYLNADTYEKRVKFGSVSPQKPDHPYLTSKAVAAKVFNQFVKVAYVWKGH